MACTEFSSDNNFYIKRLNLIVLFHFENRQVFLPHSVILHVPRLLGMVQYFLCLSRRVLHVASEHDCGASNPGFRDTNSSHSLSSNKMKFLTS